MIYLWVPVAFLLGALGRRIAGGGFQDLTRLDIGDLPVRIFYGATVALAALIGGAVWWVALLMIPAVWVGTTTGNFESMCMGHGKYTFRHDFLGMTEHGALSAVLPAVVVCLAGFVWGAIAVFLVITFTASPSYMFGWWIEGRWPFHTYGDFLSPPTPMAECIWGGLTALAVFLAFAL